MSRVELVIARAGATTVAMNADDVVAINEPGAPNERCFDIDALFGLATSATAGQRAVEVAVHGGTLIALSRADLVLTEVESKLCYGVPRILRDAGCSWLRAFVVSDQRVVPWVDIVRLLEREYTQRLFFSPHEVASGAP